MLCYLLRLDDDLKRMITIVASIVLLGGLVYFGKTDSMKKEKRPVQPPGPLLQHLNAALHKEPLSSIAHGLYWSCVFVWGAPFAVAGVLITNFVRLIRFYSGKSGENYYDPKRTADTGGTAAASTNKHMAVIITGCDSGFGKELALQAAQAGYFVFAACLQPSSIPQFQVTPEERATILPVTVDVTRDQDIEKLVATVEEWLQQTESDNNDKTDKKENSKLESSTKKRVLHAVVNNAGIGLGGNIDWMDLSAFQKTMDVNYFGMVRCCKAFLPILKRQSINETHPYSRVVNLVSASGLVAAGIGLGLYSPSKHAAYSFSTFLRREVKPFHICVTTVNPSFHGTNIVHLMSDRITKTWNQLSEEKRQEYGDDYFEHVRAKGADLPNQFSWNMQVVVDAILLECLMKRSPPPEMVIGSDARFGIVILRMLPAWICDLVSDLLAPKTVPRGMMTMKKDQQQKSESLSKQ